MLREHDGAILWTMRGVPAAPGAVPSPGPREMQAALAVGLDQNAAVRKENQHTRNSRHTLTKMRRADALSDAADAACPLSPSPKPLRSLSEALWSHGPTMQGCTMPHRAILATLHLHADLWRRHAAFHGRGRRALPTSLEGACTICRSVTVSVTTCLSD